MKKISPVLQRFFHQWQIFSPEKQFSLLSSVLGTCVVVISVLSVGVLAQQYKIHRLTTQHIALLEKLGVVSTTMDGIARDGKSAMVAQELRALRDEVIKYRAEQQGRDQILGLSTGLNLPTLTDPLQSLSNTLSTLEEATIEPTLTIPPTQTTNQQNTGAHLGTVSLLEGKSWTSVDAFDQALASSKIVGQLVVRVSYPYYAKENGWYQVELSNGKRGWVQEQFVKED
ncbi:MAG TPA: hypothetical protein DCX25_03415 [Candidatus Pacebacteria bacterium]|nr:MAG: hypothetical protein UX00_C0001G0053 [Microgenomates group bacterium GW2011_GWB1_45_17]KKU24245.1 MAG: hypothetical protein UX36_C0002G0228 [Microgenomates group bacterium GW2011_GWC1_46_15]KKU24961.1 MAG: hypothetical protein UX35_C0001G0143 [Microgenomates group bacterium GW2011_GWA1_46_15]HAV15354.1 hypothetical protein [Candidatus Paceibacterota bacterium]HCR11374.1 hypothetical protein [Candidatus Paceibacterota bacterium]